MRFFQVIFFLVCFTSSAFLKKENVLESNYVATYKELAHSLAQEFEIPYEVIMAVAIVESGSGTSKVARKLNNHFGIVGKNKVKWSRFKQYNSVEESYRDFCLKITTKKLYTRLKENTNHKDWIRAISQTGYSAHPKKWRAMIYRAIATHRLLENKS